MALKFGIFLSIVIFNSALASHNNETTKIDLQVPTQVLPQSTFNASCSGSGNHQVRMRVYHCPVIFKSLQQTKDGFRMNLHIEHVEEECEVQCLSSQEKLIKKIAVTDGIITSETTNTTVFKGMPFTLRCLSRCRSDFCQVVWTTNKAFVKSDKQHTISSSPPFKDTQSHHLTVHAADSSTDYQCSLIAITGRIIDSAKQHVYVKEPTANESIVKMFMHYIKPYLKWTE